MTDSIIEVSDGFWNIRGAFKIAGVIDIGTQASLVRLGSGNFVLLDSYTLDQDQLDEITGIIGDAPIEAIINLHPFHTVHVEAMHQQFPSASLYGTARHIELFSQLPWESQRVESPEFHERYGDDFEFSVPRGVDFISSNDNIHFSSVLALHRASGTLHVDDTVMFIVMPLALRLAGLKTRLAFHPTLASALEKRAGAAAEFREWAEQAFDGWHSVVNLCAAHSSTLLAPQGRAAVHLQMGKALKRCSAKLAQHEKRYG
jgi:hypothetical protein